MGQARWRAISTAPRDGSLILLYAPDMEMPVSMGSWFHDKDARTSEGHFAPGRWLLVEWDGMPSCCEPTHWMHLPEPPRNEVR